MPDTPQSQPTFPEPEPEVVPEAPVPEVPEVSTEELLANAPPLILPEGTSLIKQCSCGLKLDNPPANLVCPNCGATVP